MKHLTLEIESNLGDVSLVGVAVHGICTYAGLDQEKASLVELSIVEAVTNAIKHAYQGEPDRNLILTVSVDGEFLTFDLFDTGTPIPAELVERLIQGKGILEPKYSGYASISETGRGLEIIHKTMEKITYAREGSQNHLMLAVPLGVR